MVEKKGLFFILNLLVIGTETFIGVKGRLCYYLKFCLRIIIIYVISFCIYITQIIFTLVLQAKECTKSTK